MNLLQLVFKQMHQRALSSWLTTLAVLLGVALAVALMIVMRGSNAIFGQTEYGYDVIVGAKGSPLQLVLNTVYHLDQSPGNVPYSLFEQMARPGGIYRQQVRTAVPTAVGDSYKGLRIIGAPPRLFGLDDAGEPLEVPFEYRPGRRYEISQGRVYKAARFEAVIGSDVTKLTGLKLGEKFKATHGLPQPQERPDEHEELWTVVGVMRPTHTAADKCLYIPLTSFYCIFEHEEGLKAQAAIKAGEDPSKVVSRAATQRKTEEARDAHDDHDHDKVYTLLPDGTIDLHLPKDEWQLSAILVRCRSPFLAQQLMYTINNRNEAAAVNPAMVMRQFFDVFLKPYGWMLQGVACLVSIVAAISILVSIYNSVAARKKEIAILRALGATRVRILAIICVEAGLIGLFGGLLGILAGHAIGAIGSEILQRIVGEGLPWMRVGSLEWLYLAGVVTIAVLAGLVPALKAYATPVATNLVAS
jgi:putative ABC transport system permease protein